MEHPLELRILMGNIRVEILCIRFSLTVYPWDWTICLLKENGAVIFIQHILQAKRTLIPTRLRAMDLSLIHSI